MKKLLIHIGYPKTATTTLQVNVLTNLYKEGTIEYLNHIGSENEFMGNYFVKNLLSYCMGFNKEYPISELEKLVKIDRSLAVVSSESLAHVSDTSPTGDKKTAVLENIGRLHDIFSPHFDSVDVIMTIRNQPSIIHSYFIQGYYNIIRENIRYKDLGLWIQDNFGKKIEDEKLIFNYHEMYETVKKYFGTNHTHVLLYEDLIHDKKKYLSQWGAILEVSYDKIERLFNTKAQNVTVKKITKTKATDKQTLGSKVSIIVRQFRIPISLIRAIKKVIPNWVLSMQTSKDTTIRNLNIEEKELIKKRFSETNRLLFKELNCDIERAKCYGYPI
jgi:hypothetical protein